MKYTSKTWIALLSLTLCVLTCHLHHLIAAGLMVIGHLLHLKACALAGRHLPPPHGKGRPPHKPDNMRGFDPASEDDMDDNGMSRYMENNDEEGWD